MMLSAYSFMAGEDPIHVQEKCKGLEKGFKIRAKM